MQSSYFAVWFRFCLYLVSHHLLSTHLFSFLTIISKCYLLYRNINRKSYKYTSYVSQGLMRYSIFETTVIKDVLFFFKSTKKSCTYF